MPTVSSKVFLAIAFLAGAGTMLLEVLAPRIMQPYFGASTFVWTNVIGVILFAMALGYNLGGRLAEKERGAIRIAWTLSAAALLTVLVRFLFAPFAEFLLPTAESLADADSARSRLETGSLVCGICLFCPPVFLLATLTPQIIQEVVRTGRPAGRAAGAVFMWGTLGSLVGTFLPTYVLVPSFGTSVSLFVAAFFLFLPGAGLFLLHKKSKAAGVAGAALLVFVLSSASGPLRGPIDNHELLIEKESRYQYLRVIEMPALEDPSVTEKRLCIDEGLLEFHSVVCEGRLGTLGKYYDYFALLPTLFPADRKLKILVMGSGTGTMSRILCDFWPERIERVVDVEIDPGVLELAPEFDPDKDPRVESLAMDARAFAQITNEKFDLIFVDAYARQIDIPFHMTTVEFFTLVNDRLSDDGVVALNVSSKDPESELTASLLRSMSEGGIQSLKSAWVRYWGNRMIWGGKSSRALDLTKYDVHEELRGVMRHALRAQQEAPSNGSAVRLTDDHAPVELLTRKSLETAGQ